MKHFSFFPGGTLTSILGYGTPGLMGLSSTADRLALLEYAFDAGIRHFDTAPSYGYGEAERVLGKFIQNRRDQVTITTKFGIQAPPVVKTRWVNLLARRVLQLMPFLRGPLSRQARAMSKKSVFTSSEARRSLDNSLAALNTDYIDLFLLHEPSYVDAAREDLHQFLDGEVRRGRIRAFGCGGNFESIESIANAKLPTSRWLQFEDDVLKRRIERIQATEARCITFGLFKGSLPSLTKWLKADPGRLAEWERQLGFDCRSESVLAALLQAAFHARNPEGIVLFSTHRPDRISSAVLAASGAQFSTGQLCKFYELAKKIPAPS